MNQGQFTGHSQLATPCVLNLARKRLLLRNIAAHFGVLYPDSCAATVELLRDIEHDLNRADVAEREIEQLHRSNASLRGNKISNVRATA